MMSKKNKINKSWRFIMLLLLALNGSWIGGCGTEADGNVCPDTEATANDYKNLEASGWVWRVCNMNEKYAMEEIDFYGNEIDIQPLPPCKCSTYFSSENALIGIDYKINAERFTPVYLDHYTAVRGLTDSTQIRETPGRYTYYFLYNFSDSTGLDNASPRVEIERTAYHENQQEKK